MSETAGYPGQQGAFDASHIVNALAFMIRQAAAGNSHVALVVVDAVVANAIEGAPSTVNVLPMVHQIDQIGTATPHGVIYGVPTFRYQSGTWAVVLDPQKGDIGVVVCADRDISSAIANQAPANPGSFRRFDWSDAMYFGGFGSVVPTDFVRIDADGITLTTGQNVTINATSGNVTVNASEVDLISDVVNLGATGGAAVARVGDMVNLSTGVIETGSDKVSAA